jgi:predicted lipid-binding transport protein (Tim44 family)
MAQDPFEPTIAQPRTASGGAPNFEGMHMKTWLMAVLLTSLSIALVPTTADAKRLGGGRPAGMQRAAPDKPAQSAPTTPANPAANPNAPGAPANAAAPAGAGAAAAAAAPKRSWLGPVAGLAAGLGLAALFSHLGMGDEFANIVMLALLAMVAFVAIRWLMRRFASSGSPATRYAVAGASPAGPGTRTDPVMPLAIAPRLASPDAPSAGARLALPADFDVAAFERISKTIFIRLQGANDSADLNDLRAFTTPELFAALRLDLQERGSAAQQTDVVTLNAELLDFAQESERQLVSVRFHGLIREEANAPAAAFDEVWHLVRPLDGSRSWAIAGIQPAAQDAALAA